MTSSRNPIKLFETVTDQCPYLEHELSASILVDPEEIIKPELFSLLSRSGFRRSGKMLYSPKCPNCNSCVSVRIPSHLFKASRSQKRVSRKNNDLTVTIEEVSFQQKHFELYLKYQQHRHPESTMCDDDPEKYTSFIKSDYSDSKFVCFYKGTQLLGLCVVDQFAGGISAVYTFFDPEESHRSLGTYAILYLLKLARLRDIPYVYLGYWVDQSNKMDYKRNFKPMEGYQNRQWVELDL